VQTIDLRNDSWTATKASSSSFWVPRSPAHFFLVSQWSAKECDFRPGMVSYDGMLWYGMVNYAVLGTKNLGLGPGHYQLALATAAPQLSMCVELILGH